jgi:hypothetical protein
MRNTPTVVNCLSQACIVSGQITVILIFFSCALVIVCVCACVRVPVPLRDMYSHVQICPHNAEFLRYRPELRPQSATAELLLLLCVPCCNFRSYTENIAVKVRCFCEVYCCAHFYWH